MSKEHPEMSANDALAILRFLGDGQIEVWVDGGWGVDALLGHQTRVHSDLDIAVEHRHVHQLRTLLEGRGYRDVPRGDTWECNFVLGDEDGRQVDIHSCTFDKEGNNIFGVAYPFESLTGSGLIKEQPVKCISPEWMVRFHSGYKLDLDDYRDVEALCIRFGMELPAEYRPFEIKEDE